MHDDERVVDELEALKAILMDELVVKTDPNLGKGVWLETEVFPYTALDADQQFVRVMLDMELPEGYPDKPPTISLRNPRGLDDSTLAAMQRQIQDKCDECLGQPVVFEIIEVVREHLTASNVPCCQCCICLYGFRDGDHFTKTQCYHYFHTHCLAGHLTASERIFREEQDKLPAWQQTEQFQAVCAVCRAPIKYDVAEMVDAPPPLDVTEAPRSFQPSDELKLLQQQMADLFLHQKRRGGIIQEDNHLVLLTDATETSTAQANR